MTRKIPKLLENGFPTLVLIRKWHMKGGLLWLVDGGSKLASFSLLPCGVEAPDAATYLGEKQQASGAVC
jgi:hypothetical protein